MQNKTRQRLQKLESQTQLIDDTRQADRRREWLLAAMHDSATVEAVHSAILAGTMTKPKDLP